MSLEIPLFAYHLRDLSLGQGLIVSLLVHNALKSCRMLTLAKERATNAHINDHKMWNSPRFEGIKLLMMELLGEDSQVPS